MPYDHASAEFEFSGDRLVRFRTSGGDGFVISSFEWNFAGGQAQSVKRNLDGIDTYETLAIYDAENVRLVGVIFDPNFAPSPRDALTLVRSTNTYDGQTVTTETSYTYDGEPFAGTRTRTSSEGQTETFEYDERGRLIRDGRGSYVYENDRLVAAPERFYDYDRSGNLTTIRADPPGPLPGFPLSFSYDCWDPQ